MEIKTCEHFVVNRLMELENEVELFEATCDNQVKIINDLKEKLEFISNLLVIKKAHDYTPENNRMYIDLSVWNTYDKAKFDRVREILDLPLPDELEEEDE